MYISVVTVAVNDVDRAVDFYTKKLGWEKTMDVPMGPDQRWVTVQPKGGQAQFTLAKTSAQMPLKVGGMTGVILEVDDVHKSAEQLQKAGVQITDKPRTEPWGGWAMFQDSEGNQFGLHSPAAAAGAGGQ